MEGDLDPPVAELNEKLIVQARAIAWKHWHSAPNVLEFDELLSLAYKGLVEASSRWPAYCAERNFDPARTRFYAVYCLRRMEGSILDHKRSLDWVSRPVRDNARALRDAGQDLGCSEAQMADATGLSRAEVSQTLAAMARRPVGFDPVEHDIPDNADTESRAVVSVLLDAAVSALESLPVAVQFCVVLTFYSGMSSKEVGALLGLQAAEVTGMQQQGVIAVHRALAEAAGETAHSERED